MFLHNLKYTIKTLFKNKVLIFWTFAFPIILAFFFNMAFSNIEKDEVLKVFDIAIIDNEDYKNQEIYKNALEELSDDKNEDKLFNIKYTTKDEADKLLDDSEIKGYIVFEGEKPKVVVKENGVYQTIINFVMTEINRNKIIVDNLAKKEVEQELKSGNYNFDTEKIVNDILEKINNTEVAKENISNSHLSYTQIEFFTLIAMACMYGGMIGLTAINRCLANMSNKGKRTAVSATKKSVIVLSSFVGAWVVSMIGLALLMLVLIFVIKVDFYGGLGPILVLAAVGDLAGIALGVMVASCFRVSESAKTGIILAISMALSVLSGMMGITLKYIIDTNAPIVNLMNPNNLITDGFYSLYYYSTPDRYLRDVGFLLIFTVICLTISFFSLRKEKYDSI